MPIFNLNKPEEGDFRHREFELILLQQHIGILDIAPPFVPTHLQKNLDLILIYKLFSRARI